jgi:hypothetical protein
MNVSPLASSWFLRSSAALTLAIGLLAVEAHASVVLKMTFDNDGPTGSEPGQAANPYRASANDVIISQIDSITRVGTGASIPNVVTSTGPQGGLALALAGTENSGYAVDGGVDISFSAVTYEVVINVAQTSGFQSIFRQANQVGTQLGFVNGALSFNGTLYNYTPNLGEWVHLAATVSWDGTNAVSQLYLNGTLLGTTTSPESLASQVFGTLNIGFNDSGNTQFISGQIDAFAMSNTVLDPSNFVLQPVPEPAALTLLAVTCLGAMVIHLRRRRI